MESINRDGLIKVRRKPATISVLLPKTQPPRYLQIILLLLTVVAAVSICWTALVRQQTPRMNPFADYNNILPGNSMNYILTQGFQCSANNLAQNRNYCILSPIDGPFWYIHLVTTRGVVTEVSFCVRKGAITVGDLALLWGKPAIKLFDGSGLFKWSNIYSSADGLSVNRGFSYYFPIEYITITTSNANNRNLTGTDY
jgi:hypothetical protein